MGVNPLQQMTSSGLMGQSGSDQQVLDDRWTSIKQILQGKSIFNSLPTSQNVKNQLGKKQ